MNIIYYFYDWDFYSKPPVPNANILPLSSHTYFQNNLWITVNQFEEKRFSLPRPRFESLNPSTTALLMLLSSHAYFRTNFLSVDYSYLKFIIFIDTTEEPGTSIPSAFDLPKWLFSHIVKTNQFLQRFILIVCSIQY